MTSLRPISCPSCGASHFEHDEEGNLICEMCGALLASPLDAILCDVCGTLNPPQAKRCMECGFLLGKACPICHHINEPGADHCEKCAQPLDTLTGIMSRVAQEESGAVVDRMERLSVSKEVDNEYMEFQREKLIEEEKTRHAMLVQKRARARRAQLRFISVVMNILLVMAVIALIAIAYLMLKGS